MFIDEIKKKYESELLKKKNVVGVMTAFKIEKGHKTKTSSITCLVEKKIPMMKLEAKDIIPKEIDGVFTDVIEVGEIKALIHIPFIDDVNNDSLIDRKSRIRPAPMGTSGGHYKITAGTNGELLLIDGDICIGTNNHVAALSNHAELGDPYLQPGSHDGGKLPNDLIGYLYKYEPINFVGTPSKCKVAGTIVNMCNLVAMVFGRKTRLNAFYSKNNVPNLVDAAAVIVINQKDILTKILNIGIPKGVGKAHIDTLVQKSGRTTGHTKEALVTSIDATINVSYGEGKMALFTDQILISKPGFSAGGDSGSLVLNMGGFAVGKLFAGSDQVTIANHIDDYLKALDATLITDVTNSG